MLGRFTQKTSEGWMSRYVMNMIIMKIVALSLVSQRGLPSYSLPLLLNHDNHEDNDNDNHEDNGIILSISTWAPVG